MKSKRIAFFDIDGTIMDTLDSIATALNDARQQVGLEALSTEHVQKCVGYGAKELIARTSDQIHREQLEILYMQCLLKQNPQPFTYIPEILKALKKEGIIIIAASNKPHEAAIDCINRSVLA